MARAKQIKEQKVLLNRVKHCIDAILELDKFESDELVTGMRIPAKELQHSFILDLVSLVGH